VRITGETLSRRKRDVTTAYRVAAICRACMATFEDPGFLAEAGRMKSGVVWLSGAEAQAVVAKAFAPPPLVIDLAAKAIAPPTSRAAA
jgi:hypothetical protein